MMGYFVSAQSQDEQLEQLVECVTTQESCFGVVLVVVVGPNLTAKFCQNWVSNS